MDLRLTLTWLVITSGLFASEVLLVHNSKPFIVISQNSQEPFQKEDRVCVERQSRDIACGDITDSKEKFAVVGLDYMRQDIGKTQRRTASEKIIELNFDYPTPVRGDKVRLVAKDPKSGIRKLTSELVSLNQFNGETISEKREEELEKAIEKLEASRPFKPVSVLSFAMNWINPAIQYQQAITPKWGLGLMPTYLFKSTELGGTLEGPGLFFTYNRYSNGPLNGFWWQLSPGLYMAKAVTSTKTANNVLQPALLATAGWRYFWRDRMNFGFALGGQYLPSGKNAGGTNLDFNGFIPAVWIDTGIAF